MLHVSEAVLSGEPIGPPLYGWTFHLYRRAAAPADQVMVVRPPASAVELLAGGQSHGVDLARVNEKLKRSIDSRKSDFRTPVAQVEVELLGGTEIVQFLKQGQHLAPLPGIARARGGGTRRGGTRG